MMSLMFIIFLVCVHNRFSFQSIKLIKNHNKKHDVSGQDRSSPADLELGPIGKGTLSLLNWIYCRQTLTEI